MVCARRMLRVVPLCLAGLMIALAGYVGFNGYVVWSESHVDEMEPAQAIVVLGAAEYNGRPSPVLEARLAHAYYLWTQGMAPYIITTGGKEPGDTYTEAGVGRAYLERRGVPESRLLEEDRGRTTYESIRNVAALARPRGIKTLLLVSDPLDSARIQQIAFGFGFTQAATSPDSYLELPWSSRAKLYELIEQALALSAYRVGLDRS